MTGRCPAKKNPQARREYVDALTGVRTRPGPGTKASGRLTTRVRARADAPLETVVVDSEDLDPSRDRFGIDPGATAGLRAAAARVGKRGEPKPMTRSQDLDLGRAGASTTFASTAKAAEQFMKGNASIFESSLFEDADVRDTTLDFMDGIEVRQGNRSVRLSKTPRGQEILAGGGRASGGAVAKEMLSYLFGQAGRNRRWRDVPWPLITSYVHAIVRVMQDEAQHKKTKAPSGVIEWYPLSSGVYPPDEVVSLAIDELGEAKARRLADWLNSQSLFELSDKLESVLKPPKGSQGKKARRARRCLGAEDRKAVRRRVTQFREWAAYPEDVPEWACVASRETESTAVPVCMFPALEEEVRRLMDACEVPYDPSWPEREHAKRCGSRDSDELGLLPGPCPDDDGEAYEDEDRYAPSDEVPWANPSLANPSRIARMGKRIANP